ncbi:MAG: hypothetical protein RKO66_10010 [Candidatus Contendobacter sp.]|nr:hypothetical protein [Candidatus Contendobacter sp.]MDS4058989.1 hypothetical protein [Candidatus Contendobacter sp.]
MNRHPYRRGQKKRPTLKAIVERRPHPDRAPGGRGGEHVYPLPEHCRRETPEPDEEPGRYDAAIPGNVWEGEGP